MNRNGVAEVGYVVTMPGHVRGVIIAIEGTFVKVRGIGHSKEMGEKVVLDFVHDLPASECVFLGDTDPDVVT